MEYAIRDLLGEEIGLNEQYFSAVMESYDVALLIRISIDVFKKSRGDDATTICKLLNRFPSMIDERNRVAHGLWVLYHLKGYPTPCATDPSLSRGLARLLGES
jgi:hypothetical protein